jgi:hypothetical protein
MKKILYYVSQYINFRHYHLTHLTAFYIFIRLIQNIVCLQDCKVYFCGTKYDLVEDKPELRQIEKKKAQELAHGSTKRIFRFSCIQS